MKFMDNINHKKKETKAEIFGKTYNLAFDGDEEHFNQVVNYLNEKMNEVSKSVRIVDSIKVAVLTALKITDDFLTLKKDMNNVEKFDNEKAEKLLNLIDSNIEEVRNY